MTTEIDWHRTLFRSFIESNKNEEALKHLCNETKCWEARDAEGKTLLMHAAELDSVACVDILLDKGAYPLARDRAGLTALMYVAKSKRGLALDRLLKVEAKNVRDHEGRTALMHALYMYLPLRDRAAIIKRMMDSNIFDLNARDTKMRRTVDHFELRPLLIRTELYCLQSLDDFLELLEKALAVKEELLLVLAPPSLDVPYSSEHAGKVF